MICRPLILCCIVHDLMRKAKTVGHHYGEDTPDHRGINLMNVVEAAPTGQIIAMTPCSTKDDNSFTELKNLRML
jgi:hypothetical protein